MNYRVTYVDWDRISPNSTVAIAFTMMKPLQKHFAMTRSALTIR